MSSQVGKRERERRAVKTTEVDNLCGCVSNRDSSLPTPLC